MAISAISNIKAPNVYVKNLCDMLHIHNIYINIGSIGCNVENNHIY